MIEDDARLARMVSDYLGQAGMTVMIAADGAAGIASLKRAPADLVLLDLMLPDGDGLEIFRRIRAIAGAASRTPVIMLTAKGDPTDRVVGLELGAEDYIPKPFEPRELLARIRVVLRRGMSTNSGEVSDILRFGRLEIDCGARMIRLDGTDKILTSHQFALLLAMAERAGRVLTREQLIEFATGTHHDFDPALDRSIDVHIGRIRAAIEDDVKQPRRIITVRGTGYVFAKVQD
ncbi:MAG: response regulator transcription factor [Hyphomicrobiaceae bacterium]